jgi:uncharacterized LabA/DUF88 family protein
VDIERVACFVDGFNLYHAVARLRRPELKWLDLRTLMTRYVRPRSQRIEAIYYFTAFAEWLPRARHRHAEYVAALRARDVTVVMGKFKARERWCPRCRRSWVGHEEKETDVNIALHLLGGAYQDEYDHAVLVSRDSDLVPAMRMLRNRFPDTRLTVVAPPLTGHSSEMLGLATAKTSIRPRHLAQSLLPAEVRDATGAVVAVRPVEYAPPSDG